MKKGFLAALVLLVSITFVSAVFAQAKPEGVPAKAEKAAPAPEKAAVDKPAAEKAAPEKAAETEKPKPIHKPKPKGVFVGTVTAVDAAAKTLTVDSKYGTKGEKGLVTFSLENAKYMGKGCKSAQDISVGDKVAVKYAKDGVEVKMLSHKKVKAAKEAKPKKALKGKKSFKALDKNKDGKITHEELVLIFVNITPEQFKQYDKNGDGALDETEYNDAF